MFNLSLKKTSLKYRVIGALLILFVATLLGLFIAVRLFISKTPTTEFLVSSTWCSILTREVIWMFDENESFTQRTLFFNEHSGSEKVFEPGSWNLVAAQNGDSQLRIIWHEFNSREEVEQYFSDPD